LSLRSRLAAVLALLMLAALAPASAASPVAVEPEGEGSDNMRHVDNLQYELRSERYEQITSPAQTSYGTDIEFATIDVASRNPGGKAKRGKAETRDFAFAGTYINGMQIIDITDPENAEIVAVYDCAIAQGDVQVFQQGDRWLATYTADIIASRTSTDSACYRDLGITEKRYGSFIVDISNPYDPQTVGFAEVEKGSHNQTVHPSGDFLYNSNSELITTAGTQAIEVFDISDPANPELVTGLELPLRPGLGTESHDVTFSADGTRAYSAALSQTVIIDTTDPANPSVISSIFDPAINVEHQSNPITIDDPILGERDFLIIEDEFAGALPTGQCPNGGVHVYDITGDLERNPVKVGYWNVDEIRPATNDKSGGLVGEPGDISRCTAHVFELHEEEAIMTIAFYNAGVRVVDLSGLVGVALGGNGVGMTELAYYQFPDSDTWAAKTPRIEDDGSFYLYGNDVARGLDVYHYDPSAGEATLGGSWMSPTEILSLTESNPMPADYTPYCLLQ
jgi:hypothetical protein